MAINTIYLDGGVLKSAKKVYTSQNPRNIRLEDFFQYSVLNLLGKKLTGANWKEKFDPEKYLYSVSEVKEISSFLSGDYFGSLVRPLLGIKNFKIEYEIRKFEPGNYTLLHDAEKEKPGIDFILDFSSGGQSFGGSTTYLTESEELLTLNPKPNSLSFVERKKGVMKFTKYYTHQNKSPVIQVVGTVSRNI